MSKHKMGFLKMPIFIYNYNIACKSMIKALNAVRRLTLSEYQAHFRIRITPVDLSRYEYNIDISSDIDTCLSVSNDQSIFYRTPNVICITNDSQVTNENSLSLIDSEEFNY